MSQRRQSTAVGIGAASRLIDVEVHTIRYWEDEFPGLIEPLRTDGGQRRYSPEHLATLQRIKGLLRGEMLTIAGARRRLSEERGA